MRSIQCVCGDVRVPVALFHASIVELRACGIGDAKRITPKDEWHALAMPRSLSMAPGLPFAMSTHAQCALQPIHTHTQTHTDHMYPAGRRLEHALRIHLSTPKPPFLNVYARQLKHRKEQQL